MSAAHTFARPPLRHVEITRTVAKMDGERIVIGCMSEVYDPPNLRTTSQFPWSEQKTILGPRPTWRKAFPSTCYG